jgi:hypothetical protein
VSWGLSIVFALVAPVLQLKITMRFFSQAACKLH